jgi:hypothetical protein
MDSTDRQSGGKSFLDILVGIQAGTLGGIAMLVWLSLMSPLIGQPWWLNMNLFASHFYTDGQVNSGFGMVTAVGAALQITAAGVVGALNGLLTPGGRLFGLAVAAAWYLLCYIFLWKRAAPLVLIHGSQPLLLVGYFVYGSAIGWHPNLRDRARA